MNATSDMYTSDTANNRTLKLALFEGMERSLLNTIATLVRGLPDVVRVRVDHNLGQLEVLHHGGNQSLLQSIHSILLMVNTGLATSRPTGEHFGASRV